MPAPRFQIDMDQVLYTLGMLFVIVSAVSGALAAGKRRFDWIGALVMACVTALGGGTVRDILLARHPVFWMRDLNFLYASLLATVLILAYARFFSLPRRALLVFDGLGLAFFTVSGAQIASQENCPGIVVVIMGALTGAAGGVMRDVMSGEAPLLFRQGELYATASVAGATAFYACERLGMATQAASIVGVCVVVALRFAAILWQIKLPVYDLRDNAPT